MKRPLTIEKIRRSIHTELPSVDVWVYGSEARGDARVDSDIDLLVLLDGDRVSLKDRMKVAGTLYDIEIEDNVSINPVVYTKSEWEQHRGNFHNNVMRERIVL